MSGGLEAGSTAPVLAVELMESSGPVSPRHQYTTRIRVHGSGAGAQAAWERRDADGRREGTVDLCPARWAALVDLLWNHLPPGAALDLAAGYRDRKGISFNAVTVAWPEAPARLDYLLSHLEDPGGDPVARAVVAAVKALAEP